MFERLGYALRGGELAVPEGLSQCLAGTWQRPEMWYRNASPDIIRRY